MCQRSAGTWAGSRRLKTSLIERCATYELYGILMIERCAFVIESATPGRSHATYWPPDVLAISATIADHSRLMTSCGEIKSLTNGRPHGESAATPEKIGAYGKTFCGNGPS